MQLIINNYRNNTKTAFKKTNDNKENKEPNEIK